MAKQPPYRIGRIFVGDKPIEDLTPEEQTAFRERTVKRMGDKLNDFFSNHPDQYVEIMRRYDTQAS